MPPSRLRSWVLPGLLALGAVAVHLACGSRHGFFRDELYFVACGRRLAWGYVDQPPAVAVLARLGWWLSGEGGSVALFRLPAILLGASLVPLSAALARALGGGRAAMALAAAATFGAPLVWAQGHLLGMNVLELVLWSGVVLAALAAVNGAPRAWLAAGALLGLCVLTKFSAGLLAAGLLAGLLASRSRRLLASPWPWAGAALAAALAAPPLLWQQAHGWPFLELLENGRLHKNAAIGPGALLGGLALEQGPAVLLLAAAGAAHLLRRREGPEGAFLGFALVAVLSAFAALGAKPYYLGPAFPPLAAAGAVWLERRLPARPWALHAATAVAALLMLPALPIAIPLLSPEATLAWQARLGVEPVRTERAFDQPLPQHQADQLGWPGQARAVEAVVAALPPGDRARTVLYAPNYGRAAALELLGRGLPPVICGHNQYFLWGVPGAPEVVVALGGRPADYAGDFGELALAGRTPPVPLGMTYESDLPIYVLRSPRAPVAVLFRTARHYE